MFPKARLQPKVPVDVVSGPLKGRQGMVIRSHRSKVLKFILEVQQKKKGTSVEVDLSMVHSV